jgi:para-aminobenzoate synthetase component I
MGDDGDPAVLVEDFLADHGLPVRDLAAGCPARPPREVGPVCGASLFMSATAAAHLIGAPVGAPSPAPDVPDLVAVVWRRTPSGWSSAAGGPPGGRPSPQPAHHLWWTGPWQPSWTPDEHAHAVAQARDAIARGEVYQVNVVGHMSAPYRGDPAPALRRVAALPGARYAGVLHGDDWAISCASPETLVRVAAGQVTTGPIKGTRAATARGRRELLESAKERAEHIMIVDLERNDLARVAETGSVRVEELFAVRRWCDLWQAESTISARLRDGVGLAALLRAVCPGGSVTGAPKRAALAQIAALEPVGRGPSMGALGWIGHDRIDLGLTIRTVATDGRRIHVWAGGGITWGSDPEAEVTEAAAKVGPMRSAVSSPC